MFEKFIVEMRDLYAHNLWLPSGNQNLGGIFATRGDALQAIATFGGNTRIYRVVGITADKLIPGTREILDVLKIERLPKE